jgi:hypothetical protein
MATILLLMISLLKGLPNSFSWLEYWQATRERLAKQNALPEVATTALKLPDSHTINIARINNDFLVVANLNRFNGIPEGTSYCPDIGSIFFEQKHFVTRERRSLTLQFEDTTNTINFSAPPFEVYVQPTTNFEKWQRIKGCETSITLPKDVYDAVTHVLVVFIEPDMETFRAYTDSE